MEGKSLRVAYGEAITELAKENEKIVALDADLANATMSVMFAKEYPNRFFNFGIAENNLVGAAAGLAHSGLIPFVSTFAMFGAGRAYEVIRNSVVYTNANVKFGLSHSGLSVGEDGGSHQSIEDIALMRELPGMTVLVPCDPYEMKKAVKAAVEIEGPVYIRVARPVCDYLTNEDDVFVVGKANILRNGSKLCLVTTGLMVKETLLAADELKEMGVDVTVVNMHTIKPFDSECVVSMLENHDTIITVEEHSIIGGLGSAVSEALAGKGKFNFEKIGINDTFGRSGKPDELFAMYGLNKDNIVAVCKKYI